MIEIKDLVKIYRPKKGKPQTALDGINLNIEERGMVFVLGKSGSGKSTLLNVLGGLDTYDGGDVIIKGRSSRRFTAAEADGYRNTYVGFVFQEYNIFDEFTVAKNVSLAIELQGGKASKEEVDEILDLVELNDVKDRKPNELSGGQKQRVAIARALVKKPEIIMADEPTGALDSVTGKQVLSTLKKLSKDKLVIVVSHDREAAEEYGDRIIELKDGKVVSDVKKRSVQAKKGDGVVFSEGVITVKKGRLLTEEDLAEINGLIENSDSDTVISVDGAVNERVKKAAGIKADGGREKFSSTGEVNTKKYSVGDFKPIKSRLPVKDAVKMGASSLKIKPFRLFMTVLLSAVAFCLFGLAHTISSYDRVTTTVNSIKNGGISYASFTKNSKIYNADGSYWWYASGGLLDDDIKAINKKFGDGFCIPVYGLNLSLNNFQTASALDGDAYNYYVKKIQGIAEVSEENLKDFGYSVTGTLPEKSDEIAVTYYIYEHYKVAGYRDGESNVASDIRRETDLIGKKIPLDSPSGRDYFTVTAIVDTNLNGDDYKKFKPGENTEGTHDVADYLLYNEFINSVSYGPHALCFVKEGFLKDNGYTGVEEYSVNQGYSAEASYEVEDDGYVYSQSFLKSIVALSDVEEKYIIPFSSSGTHKDADAFVDLSTAVDIYNGKTEENDRINLSDIAYDKAYDYALVQYRKKPSLFKNFISEQMGDVSVTEKSVAEAYANYYRLKFSGFNYPDEYIQPLSYFTELVLEESVNILSSGKLQNVEFKLSGISDGENVEINQTLEIKGVVVTYSTGTIKDFYKSGRLYLYESAIENMDVKLQKNGIYSFALGNMPSSYRALYDMVEYSFDESGEIRYWLNNTATSTLLETSIVLEAMSLIFLYVGFACAAFACALMANFIATSISYKKRDIGILRAVGARGRDVFLIFFSESIIIACINWLIASVGTFVFANVINSVIKNQFFLNIAVLNAGLGQVGLIFVISMAVAFVSGFFPVWNISRKKPIDAIKNK